MSSTESQVEATPTKPSGEAPLSQAATDAAASKRSPVIRHRLVAALGVAVLVALPYFFVDVAPGTDLPQHMAQVRLLGDALSDPGGSSYEVQWYTPYALVYLPLSLTWLLFEPLTAVRLSAALIAVLWIAAVHLLAARFDRPVSAACLASVLVFNQTLYWGFLNFLLGFVVFACYVVLLDRRRPESASILSNALPILVGALLLYSTHALWFAVAALWTGVSLLLHPSRSRFWSLLLGWLPAGILAGPTFLLFQSTASSPAEYFRPLIQRIDPSLLPEVLFGGLRHPIELWISLALVGYLLLVVITNRRDWKLGVSRELLLLAGLLLLLYFLLPSRYTRTVLFNTRFFAPAVACLLLALPRPRIDPRAAMAYALAVLVVFVSVTGTQWVAAERNELSGLLPALEAIPDEPLIIGVNTIANRSRYFDGIPYLQTVAYSQVLKGGRLSSSFADSRLSLVVFKEPRLSPASRMRTPLLEWMPERVVPDDFRPFDFAMISGGEATHRRFSSIPILEPVTSTGVWRLYSVDPGTLP